MLRILCNNVINKVLPNARGSPNTLLNSITRIPLMVPRAGVAKVPQDHDETDEEYDDRMECYFSRGDIDGWELRKGLQEIAGIDGLPEPRVLCAALCACRRVNDYALTTRMLEMVKFKCGAQEKTLYPYMLKELEPTMIELGIDTPEKLGYGEPELWMPNIFDMH